MRMRSKLVLLYLVPFLFLQSCTSAIAATSTIQPHILTEISAPTLASTSTQTIIPLPTLTPTPILTPTSTSTPDFYTAEERAMEHGEWWTFSYNYNHNFGSCSSWGDKRIQVVLPEPGELLKIDPYDLTRESPNIWTGTWGGEVEEGKITQTVTLTISEEKLILKDVITLSWIGTSICETEWTK